MDSSELKEISHHNRIVKDTTKKVNTLEDYLKIDEELLNIYSSIIEAAKKQSRRLSNLIEIIENSQSKLTSSKLIEKSLKDFQELFTLAFNESKSAISYSIKMINFNLVYSKLINFSVKEIIKENEK